MMCNWTSSHLLNLHLLRNLYTFPSEFIVLSSCKTLFLPSNLPFLLPFSTKDLVCHGEPRCSQQEQPYLPRTKPSVSSCHSVPPGPGLFMVCSRELHLSYPQNTNLLLPMQNSVSCCINIIRLPSLIGSFLLITLSIVASVKISPVSCSMKWAGTQRQILLLFIYIWNETVEILT